MKLYILEGCHAAGKTTILSKLKENNSNITIKNEGFFDLERFNCDSILHQTDWLLDWINTILKFKKENKTKVISDRGPISSVIYRGDKFKFLIDEIYKVLEKNDIKVINLLVKSPDIKTHKQRIISRAGPLVDIELENLEGVRKNYENYCKDYIEITNIDDLINIIDL
jgi:thymidylate kinase